MSLQDVFVVGGHINYDNNYKKGNVFTVPSNGFAEFNMYLDPLAAKTVFESKLNITLIPLGTQRSICSFPKILKRLRLTKKKTPEALFALRLLSTLHWLQRAHHKYQHMVIFKLLNLSHRCLMLFPGFLHLQFFMYLLLTMFFSSNMFTFCIDYISPGSFPFNKRKLNLWCLSQNIL